MNTELYTRKNISNHIISWVLYIVFYIYQMYVQRPDTYFPAINFITFFIMLIATFYVSSDFIFPRFLATKRYIYLSISFFIVFSCFLVYRYLFLFIIIPLIDNQAKKEFNIHLFLPGSFWLFIQHVVYGYGLYAIRREKERRLIEQQNAELEKKTLRLEAEKAKLEAEKLQAENKALHFELGFLRAQLNPHFIFNTMSTFRRKAYLYNEAFADAIARFSEILQYTLQDHNQLVTLQKEVDSIENFISVYQLQHGGKLVIDFTYSGDLTTTLPSALLISFVENAFKYGMVTNPNRPLRISLHLKDDTLHFITYNLKRNNGILHASTGIGIAHTRTRLQYFYPDRFTLETINTEDDFTLQLTIEQLSQPVLTSPYSSIRL